MTAETDLISVKELMARVRMQGKVLEKAETHFMTVEGRPGGKASKQAYEIDQQFVKKILEFSSSSFLSSSSLSSSNSSKQPSKVPTSNPASLPPNKSHHKHKSTSHHPKASHPPLKSPNYALFQMEASLPPLLLQQAKILVT